jgi:hypothetical protein
MTIENLKDFPLQEGINPGAYYDVCEYGDTLFITIASMDCLPVETLTFNGAEYRFAEIQAVGELDGTPGIDLRYTKVGDGL